jgi:parvulin-like peptidyl-prolyl isomerase
MKTLMLFALTGIAAFGQGQIQPGDPDPVVANLNGKDYKKSDLELLVRSVGGQVLSNYYKNKQAFIEQLALTLRLEELADQKKVGEQEPYKSRLAYNRTMLLATAVMTESQRDMKITPADQEKYYAEHKSEFSQAQTKIIYLPMMTPGKAPKSEAELQTLAQEIVKRARGGEDFVALVKQYSEDPDSKAKDGDYPPFKPTDNTLPPPVMTSVFALKPGEVSDPVRQGAGFYIFKLVKFAEPEFDKIRDDVYLAIQKARFDVWIADVRKSVKVEIKDQKYLSEGAPARK